MIDKLLGTDEYIQSRIFFINNLDISDEIKKLQINNLFKEYTVFKMLQRLIAIIFTIIYVLAIVITIVSINMGYDYKAIIAIISAFNLGMIILAILGFYFSGGAINSIRRE